MATIPQITEVSTVTSTTADWNNLQGIRSSAVNSENPTYLRTLTLDNVGWRITHGNYTLGITSEALIALAIAIVPQLTWPPRFTTQPTTHSAGYGASTTFTVVVDSELSVTYQWQISTDANLTWSNLTNAGVYSGVTTVTLTISDTSGLNGRYYRCVATNASGSTNSTFAVLTVTDPAILTQPTSASVVAPAAHNFTVTAGGASMLTYQWGISTDGGTTWNNLTNSGVYTGVTTVTLAISDSTGLNGKKYRVTCTDSAGSIISNVVTLTVT